MVNLGKYGRQIVLCIVLKSKEDPEIWCKCRRNNSSINVSLFLLSINSSSRVRYLGLLVAESQLALSHTQDIGKIW